MKVLLVEDNDGIRDALVPLLERLTDELFVAKDGYDGLELAREHYFDVIITDYHMPRMNGIEMIEHIQEFNKSTKFIITTAHPSDVDAKYKVFIKPLNTSKLKRYLKKES